MECTVGIGLLGCGTVGESSRSGYSTSATQIERRSGVRYDLRAMAIRDARKSRGNALDACALREIRARLVDDPAIDLIDGVHWRNRRGGRIDRARAWNADARS